MNSTDYLTIAVKGAERLRPETAPEREIYDEEHREHELAVSRGERLSSVADRVADELFATGQINNRGELRAALIPVLCDALFPGLAVDIPRLR